MKRLFLTMVCLVACVAACAGGDRDWAQFGRYAQANAELKRAPEVVFMGNSITDFWVDKRPDFWSGHAGFVGRGISGQTTSEMLVRFRQDVIGLNPKVVVILAGINDIARNNGIIELKNVLGNIQSMVELARLHKIKVAVCSVLPCEVLPWRPDVDACGMVKDLNGMLKAMVASRHDKGVMYVDYYTLMTNSKGGLDKELSDDGCHPLPAGYAIMEDCIVKSLKPWVKK